MNILGINAFFHDSSAALVQDGRLVAAAEEERFTRKKHDLSWPKNAIEYCLKQGNITIEQVDYIGFYEKPLLKFERVMSQFLETFPKGFGAFRQAMPGWFNDKLRVMKYVRKKLKYRGDVFFIEHHLAHAASSFFCSPFQESAILTTDGVGEWQTTTTGIAKGQEITLGKEIIFPHSLGLIYSTVTAYLGFSVNNAEYKVMGLAAYGKPVYYDNFLKLVDIKEDGSYSLDMSYFDYTHKMRMPSRKFIELFGRPRGKNDPMEQRHKDMAASLQKLTEDVLFRILNSLHKETGMDNLCMAGGVALNSVANGKILSKTPFRDIFIQPAAGDGGTAVGAAFYAYNSILGKKREYVMRDAYLGPGYSTREIRQFLDKEKVNYSSFDTDEQLVKTAAKLIAEGNVLGWFQGRMEFGPRALGARSILSDATNPEMQDILNLKVKHREKFRPFAPAVCEDDAIKYFECDEPVPAPTDFMLMVYPIRPQFRQKLPAVTHVDGSGRLQSVRREQNRLYYDVIKAFGKLKGMPIIINTSFNIRGEPIVCTPEDAYRCMMGTGIDYLFIDRFLVARKDNPKDMWDSEATATD